MSEGKKSADSAANSRKSGEKSTGNLALYRKYRSRNLDEILGQPQVTDILKIAAKNDNFAHSYLLVGQRGTGKTSVARILAHLINATDYEKEDFDIIEIDAASHGSVDDARELRDRANLAPMKARNKVYIIDEVHMLSRQAFDALLKLIEEPPKHLYFILATTELQKVPATIISRVQKFTFRPVSAEIVANHLREIADKEEIAIDDEALLLLAERGGGSFRDSITLLDQLKNSAGTTTRADVEQILGLVSGEAISRIIDFLTEGNLANLVNELNILFANGNSATEFARQLIDELAKIAIAQPEFYELIENLLDVAKSSAPEIKLISVLAQFANSHFSGTNSRNPDENFAKKSENKTVSVSVEIPKKINKIEKELSRKPAKSETKVAQEAEITDENESENFAKNESKNEKPASKKPAKSEINLENFDWEKVLETFANLDEPAAFAIANAAEIRIDGSELILFFAKKFWRGKADTKNFREILARAIRESENENVNMPEKITIAKTAVPRDSDAAKVLDILGGEIVNL